MVHITSHLERLAYDGANFAHSDHEPTSMDSVINGPRPFLYRWREDEGMDILLVQGPAKLFRYNKRQIHAGVDLTKDPHITGEEVDKIIQAYADAQPKDAWPDLSSHGDDD